MAPSIIRLPNGRSLTVDTVFGGLYFKYHEFSNHVDPPSLLPRGWTVVLNSADEEVPKSEFESIDPESEEHDPERQPIRSTQSYSHDESMRPRPRTTLHRFKRPSLRNDHLYISGISHPSNEESQPTQSPTRRIAMLLWCTLLWYFQQPPPDPWMKTAESTNTPDQGKPRGDWRININQEGILKGGRTLQKLERMGLIASEDSCVGAETDERSGEGWMDMFVSQRSFWQIDPRIFLFSLLPISALPIPSGTPHTSRPSSPGRHSDAVLDTGMVHGLWSSSTPDPFHSTSHLPTFYPPVPPQYIFTNGVRHPIRPKPPRQGETVYIRFVPSVGQFLSFRVASSSRKSPAFEGPRAMSIDSRVTTSTMSDTVVPSFQNLDISPCDPDLLHQWMNNPRISYYWGCQGPQEIQDKFLRSALKSRHSFPSIGCWDGRPFGYFEIYWVKEDSLGKHLGGGVGNYDRGIHCLVGEQEFRGPQRVKLWLTALVHHCWISDNRTEVVVMEPRVDNKKLEQYCLEVGFFKEQEVTLPHKQSYLLKIRRDTWVAPEI
ncbi:hypothetical protein P152DRAFT_472639 [Eremomyces bilateralis CBS 781.70]|uniref:Acyltransferase MbtK/IucB-like conserved domain-containing protein n=1 Tax=Eremomyces bilateralis CBS 781.70 TaxID=1392243 RepID=A0A6G1G7G4_9PEZI|nr:uncharacterized protein P152DRAFT_472639 [Eremomyces bilateralis CBS 781.70]KAF1813830.1 hypothetical protein P152DRAFT_472639 [Eremomyces bilateralis CBS 781.70]